MGLLIFVFVFDLYLWCVRSKYRVKLKGPKVGLISLFENKVTFPEIKGDTLKMDII